MNDFQVCSQRYSSNPRNWISHKDASLYWKTLGLDNGYFSIQMAWFYKNLRNIINLPLPTPTKHMLTDNLHLSKPPSIEHEAGS